MKPKAVIYDRQSSGSEDYSESVEVQRDNCRQLALHRDIEILDVLCDLNISGKTYPAGWEVLAAADRAFQHWAQLNSSGKYFRSGFGTVIKKLPEIDYVIVDDITRLYRPLTRSYLESAVNQSLIENNVQILQVKGGKLDLAQFDQQLVTMLRNQINDEQISKQRARSIEVLNNLRNSGIMPTGITAFGLEYDRISKKYTANPEKIEVVKYIFQAILQKNSYSDIIREVNQRWKHLFNGCFWEKNLYSIANKPIYAGCQYNSRGELIPNLQGHAAILPEQFLQVQKIMQEKCQQNFQHSCNRRGISKHWLPLSGRLYCGHCGSRLVVAIEQGKISYICRRGQLLNMPECRLSRIAAHCTKPHITGIVDAVQVLLGNGLIKRYNMLSTEDKKYFSNDPAFYNVHTTDNIKQLQGLADELAGGKLTIDIYCEKVSAVHRQLHNLRSQYPSAANAAEFLMLFSAYKRNTFSYYHYEELLQETVQRIDVYADNVIIQIDGRKIHWERKLVLRQKGFSLNMLTRERNRLTAILEKLIFNSN